VPFTPSHAAAVLPFLHTPLPASALVVGSMVPDIPYYLPVEFGWPTHTALAVLTTDVVLGGLAWASWHGLLAAPALANAPAGLRARIGSAIGLRRRLTSVTGLAWTVAALVVGSASHVLWDEFTHPRRWGTEHLPALRGTVGPPARLPLAAVRERARRRGRPAALVPPLVAPHATRRSVRARDPVGRLGGHRRGGNGGGYGRRPVGTLPRRGRFRGRHLGRRRRDAGDRSPVARLECPAPPRPAPGALRYPMTASGTSPACPNGLFRTYLLRMRRVSLPVRTLDAYSSTGVDVTRFGRVEQPVEGFGVDVATFAARSRIGRHPTRLWQLFAVVSGEGWAAGPDGHAVPLVAGDAVLFEPGEQHASGSSVGMVAVIVQSPVPPLPLDPAPAD
jgi:quercetin dioxygenase-like cupin family protein